MMRQLTFFVVGIFVLTACGSDKNNKVEEDTKPFYAIEDTTSFDEVYYRIEDSIQNDPDNIKLWIRKGIFCKNHLKFQCALDAGARAFMMDSTNIEARKLYAWSLINKPNPPVADIERAQRHFQYVLSIHPNDPANLVNLANTYSLTGDFDTALKYINDALRIDKFYRDGYVLKGSIYKTIGNNDLALSSYQTALQIDPDFFIGQLQTAWLLTKMNKDKLALENYRNASELKPENINALYGIARSHQNIGEYDEALNFYRKILKVDSTFYISIFNQGYIKQHYQNQLDSATYYYYKVIDMNSNYIRAWYQLGKVYVRQERNTEAAKAFAEALKIDEDFKPARAEAAKLEEVLY